MADVDAAELLRLLAALPEGTYVKIAAEVDDSGRRLLTACYFVEPPEDGWATEADYHGLPPGGIHSTITKFPWKHDDGVRFGVSAWADDPEAFVRLLTGALRERIAPAPSPGS